MMKTNIILNQISEGWKGKDIEKVQERHWSVKF